jgi:uncharacterized protein YigA (DUF484 family)
VFLRSRPEFVRDDPELMQALGVRPDAANVIDFGPAALSRAASAHRKETSVRRRLEAVARPTSTPSRSLIEAVIELLGARNHSDLAVRLDALAKAHFGLAAAVIALEGPERTPAGWRALAEGQVRPDDRARQAGAARRRSYRARPLRRRRQGRQRGADPAFAAGPRRVRGVLAFGAADEAAFSSDMGHELIDFLARVVERTAERWPLA